jgi:peptide/nickel transport system substrate-binding protein
MNVARPGRSILIAVLVGLLVAAACGGGDDGPSGNGEDAGPPQRGGTLIYGLEAETSGGYCLPEAQLAISGIQVARSMYDTLTAPNEKGEIVPYLAESVEPNDDYTQWTVKLRSGIKFHDGTDLDAQVVKNNLDAVRGQYEGRTALLGLFVFSDVADIQVVDDLSLTITTKRPWIAFDSYLFGGGRFGIMAQAQLDDQETCDRKLIGTGPFKFVDWSVNEVLTVERNPDYWQEAPDGEPFPYLDTIEFRPIVEAQQRVNALQAGDVNAVHSSSTNNLTEWKAQKESGEINLYASDDFAEVGYVMLNSENPPFNNRNARLALAYGSDREAAREVLSQGQGTIANGPFAPGVVGYLEDTGFPEYDPEQAQEYLDAYEEETGGPLEFSLATPPDPELVASAQYLQQRAEEMGVTIEIRQVEQVQLINDAIGGNFEATFFRNHPGGDPDGQYVWWRSGSPVNFGRINDPEIDAALDAGRGETDPDKRRQLYEDINREFGKDVWNIWAGWTEWGIAHALEVHGIPGPNLPNGDKVTPGLALGHPLHGIWIEQ